MRKKFKTAEISIAKHPINPLASVNLLKKEFRKNRVLSIPDFFRKPVAEGIYEFFNEQMAEDWWHLHTNPPHPDQTSVRKFPYHEPFFREEYDRIAKLTDAGTEHFTSYYWRTYHKGHGEGCACVQCRLEPVFEHESMLELLHDVTGIKVKKAYVGASWFAPGCFLTTHCDTANGKLGIVYNMTKNWQIYFGGNLHFVEQDDWDKVLSLHVPKFNNLIVFDVSDHRNNHFVSQVAQGISQKRLAFSGWYD